MPPIIGDNLWPQTAPTPPAAPSTTAPPAEDGDTQWQATAAASQSTASCATSTTPNCEPPDLLVATNLIRRLIDLVRLRTSLLSSLAINGEINTLAARQQAELLIGDAQSIMSLIADLPQPATRNSQLDQK